MFAQCQLGVTSSVKHVDLFRFTICHIILYHISTKGFSLKRSLIYYDRRLEVRQQSIKKTMEKHLAIKKIAKKKNLKGTSEIFSG